MFKTSPTPHSYSKPARQIPVVPILGALIAGSLTWALLPVAATATQAPAVVKPAFVTVTPQVQVDAMERTVRIAEVHAFTVKAIAKKAADEKAAAAKKAAALKAKKAKKAAEKKAAAEAAARAYSTPTRSYTSPAGQTPAKSSSRAKSSSPYVMRIRYVATPSNVQHYMDLRNGLTIENVGSGYQYIAEHNAHGGAVSIMARHEGEVFRITGPGLAQGAGMYKVVKKLTVSENADPSALFNYGNTLIAYTCTEPSAYSTHRVVLALVKVG